MPSCLAYDGFRIPPVQIRHLTLRDVLVLLPFTTGAAAVVSVALVTVKAWRQPSFAYADVVRVIAAVAVLVAIAISVGLRGRARNPPPWLNRFGATSWLLGLQLGILCLAVPVFALVKNVAADNLEWSWTYLNKRWLVALYAVLIATVVVFPVACAWWRAAPQAVPRRPAPPARPRRALIGGLAAATVLACWFAGPPWHLDRHHREIEFHEQAHLGALQAIARGYLPYIGPASTQYGPGSQQVLYAVMRRMGRFDIVAVRTGWATLNFTALLIVAGAAFVWLDVRQAIFVVLITIIYSPLAFFNTAPDGTLRGFYGWANAWRYISPLLVVPSLAGLTQARPGRRPLPSRWVIPLGAVWGLGSWMAQENLSSTAVSAGLLLTVLLFTGNVRLTDAIRAGRDLLIGFVLVAALVVLYYARHGAAAAFVANYFAVPSAVAAGFQNTWWPHGEPGTRTFYALPPLVLAMAVATLWQLPSLTWCAPLDPERVRFIAFVTIQLVCYQVALLRSDAGHLQNTTIALPFVLVLGIGGLPRWNASAFVSRGTIRWVMVIVVLAVLPSGRLFEARETVFGPARRFLTRDAPSATSPPDPRVAYARATPLLTDEPLATGQGTLTMREWLDFASEVHRLIGSRPVFIVDAGALFSGALYFFADLTPAPIPLERDTMTINSVSRARVLIYLRTHPEACQALISTSIDLEAQAFLDTHPGAERLERMLGPTRIHILLAQPAH